MCILKMIKTIFIISLFIINYTIIKNRIFIEYFLNKKLAIIFIMYPFLLIVINFIYRLIIL